MKYYHFKLNSFNIIVELKTRRYILQTKYHLCALSKLTFH